MVVWVLQGIHEGEMFATTHLTEKGAALADGDSEDPPEWDIEKMKVMKRRELWEIFREWSEMTWDNDHGFQLEVNSTVIQA